MMRAGIDLEIALERCLATRFEQQRSIVALRRAPSEYGSSFAIENLTVLLDDSTQLQLIFKNLGTDGLLAEASRAKPAFIHDPMREICTYQRILSSAGLGTASCYGFVADAAESRYWLFLEKVPGIELYQVGELAVWQRAAEWLAEMHRRLAAGIEPLRSRCRLLNYDAHFYRTWLSRAQRFRPNDDRLAWIADRYDRVIRSLNRLPPAFIHGEFYASNVIISGSGNHMRVCPIDWEMAAMGPPLMDVAALTSGKWSDNERRQLALAYWNAWNGEGEIGDAVDEFLESLDYCRLHLCIQWLGWAPIWSPPKAHAHDWLGEAMNIAKRLGI